VCDLAEALAEDGHWVRLIAGPADVPPGEVRGVPVIPVLATRTPSAAAAADPEGALGMMSHAAAVYREVARLHVQERPVDAVVAPLWRSEGAACVLDDRFATVVSCMTSLVTLTELDPLWGGLPDIAERLALERETMRRSRYLHGLTEAVLSSCVDDYELDPDETSVIGRGLRDRSSRVFADANDTPNVLFVGRLERRKGVDTLLDAARLLIDEDVGVTFTLAGPTADATVRSAFDRHAANNPKLSAAVRFTGTVSDQELDKLYADADIICAPSRYESHGVVLIEAMMFHKPVVTCDAGGIVEVVDPGRNALVSAPEDAAALATSLRRLVEDRQLRARMGACGRMSYERRFRATAAAHQMEAFLERVISRHRRATGQGSDVATRFAELAQAVLSIAPRAASELARELISDPPATAPVVPHGQPAALSAQAQSTLCQLHDAAAATPRAVCACVPGAVGRVTAVVLTHNRPGLALRALDSLARATVPAHILVIDNNSDTDAARTLIAACAAREDTELHRSDVNLGCAGGRRLAVELVDSEFVLFLDDDAELLPNALEHLLDDLDAHPETGAVSATVVNADGLVFHSGGSVRLTSEIADFSLIGGDLPFEDAALPPTGPAGWVPGTAVLTRRVLLDEFPIDDAMSAYFEDNEWCHRVELARPGSFRRSREALVLHHFTPKFVPGTAFSSRSVGVQLLAAQARFYERHGLLLTPSLFYVVPDLSGPDGTPDLASARLLMELVSAKGTAWTLAAWTNGELAGLMGAGRRLADAQAQVQRIEHALAGQTETLAFLHERHETLRRVECGGWWRLRRRALPALRVLWWLRGRS
jgi:glycosyltransferase involved in cell wall biosynthesis